MGKVHKNAANKHLQARIDFLDRAARYLASHREPLSSDSKDHLKDASSVSTDDVPVDEGTKRIQPGQEPEKSGKGLPLLLSSHIRAVSLKGQIRLPPDLKRSICKVCGTPLIPGVNSRSDIENLSKDRKKPWADVKVVACQNCNTVKRFPVGATRQVKKRERVDLCK